MDVLTAKPLPDHMLKLRYADGSQRLFDMKPLLGMKPWQRLQSVALFNQVRVAYGTVVWHGEIDIAPETLWLDSVEIEAAT